MKPWREKLYVGDIWQSRRAGEIDIATLTRGLLDRMKSLRQRVPEEVVEAFNVPLETNDVDDFDDALDQLYDWADEGKRLWIDTFGGTPSERQEGTK